MPHDDDRDDLSALDFSVSGDDGTDDHGGAESDALDFSVADDPDADSAVDALSEYGFPPSDEAESGLDAIHSATEFTADARDTEAEDGAPLFTVTNPGGTVSVSAMVDGSVKQVELSPRVTAISEAELAEEILLLADLARQKGLAGQYAFIMDVVAESEDTPGFGADDVKGLAGFLTMEDGLNLPTPAKADAAQAEVFAARYAADQGRI